MSSMRPTVIVLAAGQGTRMRSRWPKVLHAAAGRPLLEHVLRAARGVDPDVVAVVVGYGADVVRARFAGTGVTFVEQAQQRGTGDAVACCAATLGTQAGPFVVLSGDGPLITSVALQAALEAHAAGGGAGMTLLTTEVEDPSGLGRVVRGPDGCVRAIVEDRDADAATRALREVNPGSYVFDDRLWSLLDGLDDDNAAHEFYLTDLVAAYLRAGLPVRAVTSNDETRLLVGVNDRAQLALADRLLRDRIRSRWLAGGVTMVDPTTVYLDDDVVLERDVVLEPGVVLTNGTRVGEGAVVGAYAHLDGCDVSSGACIAPHTVATGRSIPVTPS